MSEELKPCPFCGEPCHVEEGVGVYAGCGHCCINFSGVPATAAARERAVTKWNTRATPQPAPGAMREVLYCFGCGGTWTVDCSCTRPSLNFERVAVAIRALPAPIMPDAEPTEAMIEAGMDAMDIGDHWSRELKLKRAFRAMLAARPIAAIDGEEG